METKGFDIKNTPGYIQYADAQKKSPFLVENAWKQRMFTTLEKRDLIFKTPLAIFNMQMYR